ncbi:MAG: hypothetical protein EPN88_01110 [Bacteroidetes bacterium]|nr:MAG: hypothetical protein EPN88_01110 [Bacteroidota bacterium]
MAKVIVIDRLKEEIYKKFKATSVEIFELLDSLENNPNKGKPLGNVGSIIIKELKYENYRFYFITDGFTLKVMDKEELNKLIITFVRMSDKKSQQKTIDEIKDILRKLGEQGFE